MDYSTIRYEKVGHVATITLNRPEKLNATNQRMVDELLDVFEQMGRDDTVRVGVLTGAGRAFCAGGDINWFSDFVEESKEGQGTPKTMNPADGTRLCLAVRGVPQPTIASINGVAVGGGMTVALNCDIRIAAEEASISLPFAAKAGIVPEIGSTYVLPRLIGIAKACELIFTGKAITGKEAKEIGLVNEAVPLAELPAATQKMAETMARASAKAVQLAKRGLYQGMVADIYSQLLWEEEALRQTFGSEDNEEAISAFLEKRKPRFEGKR